MGICGLPASWFPCHRPLVRLDFEAIGTPHYFTLVGKKQARVHITVGEKHENSPRIVFEPLNKSRRRLIVKMLERRLSEN